MASKIVPALVVSVFASACAYHAPNAPTPPPAASTTAPAFLTLGAAPGSGTDAGRSTVTAKVQNINGAPLAGVTVAFQIDRGTIAPAAATTDNYGTAVTTMTATDSSKVSATAGGLSSTILIASQPTVFPPSPTPAPNPQPAPLDPLSLTISAGSSQAGLSTLLTASIGNSSGAVSLAWDYGDGTNSNSTSPTTAHIYASGGTYQVSAIARDAGRTASATMSVIVRN